jgi:hypothetical protein
MWCWFAAAFAGDPVLEDQVRTLMGDLVPAVQAAAGRPFDHLPRIVLTDPATETPLLVEQFARSMPRERAWETAAVLAAYAFAAYVPDGDEIVVFADRFSDIADDGDLQSDVLRCSLAHELVHALQAQQEPELMAAFEAQSLMQRIAIEGHAQVVGEKACGRAAGVGYLRWSAGAWARPGTNGVVGLWGPGELLYGWGSKWMERRMAVGGPEVAWGLLADPPDLETFEAEVLDELKGEYGAPAWPTADEAADTCARMGASAGRVTRRYGGPTHRNDPNFPWWPGSYQDWELVPYLRTISSWRCSNGVDVVAIDAEGAGAVLADRRVDATVVRKRGGVVWVDDLGMRRWEASGRSHHVVIYPNERPVGPGAAARAMRALGLRSPDEPGYDGW